MHLEINIEDVVKDLKLKLSAYGLWEADWIISISKTEH